MPARKRAVARYRVVAERSGGVWVGTVPRLPGVVTQARTLAALRRRAVEAIAVWLDRDPRGITVRIAPVLPPAAAKLTDQAARKRAAADRTTREASSATRAAVAELRRAGLSVRDTSDVLGMSPARVDQLA